MTSILLQPRCDGVDAASFAKLTNFQNIVDAGYEWISFYLGGTYGVGKAQIDGAWRVGLPIMLNFERSANAALGGTVAGQSAAVTALSQAKALGFLGEAPLIFSGVDFGPTVAQFPALDAYHRALTDVFTPEGWVGGAYGPRSYLSHLAGQDWWPDDWPLWHWGGDGFTVYEWAHAKQWYGKKPANLGDARDNSGIGYSIDENTLLKPMRFWSGYGEDKLDPVEIPPVVEADMTALFQTNDAIHWPGSPTLAAGDYPPNNGHVFTVEVGGAVRHVPASEFAVYLVAPVVPVKVVKGVDLKGMLDANGVYAPPVGVKGDKGDPGSAPHGTFAATVTIP